VIAINKNRKIASLTEAKNSTSSRENSSQPRPGVDGRIEGSLGRASGWLFMRLYIRLRPGQDSLVRRILDDFQNNLLPTLSASPPGLRRGRSIGLPEALLSARKFCHLTSGFCRVSSNADPPRKTCPYYRMNRQKSPSPLRFSQFYRNEPVAGPALTWPDTTQTVFENQKLEGVHEKQLPIYF
jgi:hypothetical protein